MAGPDEFALNEPVPRVHPTPDSALFYAVLNHIAVPTARSGWLKLINPGWTVGGAWPEAPPASNEWLRGRAQPRYERRVFSTISSSTDSVYSNTSVQISRRSVADYQVE